MVCCIVGQCWYLLDNTEDIIQLNSKKVIKSGNIDTDMHKAGVQHVEVSGNESINANLLTAL